eukprot:TRINITY_DN288_c0_g1_i4.p1 TRINITY_DN288_c0_g1~~TRINITY_DN288_c0_g1_i4.p1  ORF type:complete len:451 (+),score=42.08 TRINITY_DN288_c0_g1_i4:93-1445(+)
MAAIVFLAPVLLSTSYVTAVEQFTVYSHPMTVVRGQVHNNPTKLLPLPVDIVKKYKGKSMGVVKFQTDIVRIEDGEETRIPLSEVYNHHTIQTMGPNWLMSVFRKNWAKRDPLAPPELPHCGNAQATMMQAVADSGYKGLVPKWYFGPVGGAEYRDADRDLPAPYRQIVDSPESFVAIMHFINSKAPAGDYPLFECPCTSDRVIDPAKGTIDGVKPLPFACDQGLLDSHNDGCKLEWYKGGYRCCEDKAWVTEPQYRTNETDTFQAKFTLTVDDVNWGTKPTYFMELDVTGRNAEYEIPKCNLSNPFMKMEGDTCVHTVTTVQPILHAVPQVGMELPWGDVELITARGHQHLGGLGMELWNERTGELICKSTPRMGTNGAEPGNEEGFIVGIEPCVWGTPGKPPPKLRKSDNVRIVSRYNATRGHYGVMGLWFMQGAVTGHLTDNGHLVV